VNKVFSIFIQLAFKYLSSNNMRRCLRTSARSTSSEWFIAGLPPTGQTTLVSGRWSVALRPSVCLSVPCLRFAQKSEYHRNFKFRPIGNWTLKATYESNCDSHRFNEWKTIELGKNLL